MILETNDIVKRLARLDMWGQLNQTQEECAELIAAINKLRRHKTGSYDMVEAEIADVCIMMAQCRLIIGPEHIDKVIIEKLARCEERLLNGKL